MVYTISLNLLEHRFDWNTTASSTVMDSKLWLSGLSEMATKTSFDRSPSLMERLCEPD